MRSASFTVVVLIGLAVGCQRGGRETSRVDSSTGLSPAPGPGGRSAPSSGVIVDAYDLGNPKLLDIWVDPNRGKDDNSGQKETDPLRSITSAMGKVPKGVLSATGYRINLLPGNYPCEPGPESSNCINYFESIHGTHEFPVIVRAARGRNTVVIRGGMNLKGMRHFHLMDLEMRGGGKLPTNSAGNNLLHLEGCDHVLLRGVTLTGPSCANDTCNNLQEVLKANQCQHLYVEESEIGGAWHSAVDYMVVQYGHVLRSHLRGAGQWCMYVKGGSAEIRLEGNELEGCQLGFQAGQSANFAMMQSPWLHYEAYGIQVVNNVFHDIAGVPLSVMGGYNVLMAHNTLYRVATSTEPGYPLFQAVYGERNCTATDELPKPVPVCVARGKDGGWGPSIATDSIAAIPNRHVYVINNVFYNPLPHQSRYSHFSIEGALRLPKNIPNLPAIVRADDDLVIAGNVIWNGTKELPLGVEEAGQGCQPDNPRCNVGQLRTENAFNIMEPILNSPLRGDYGAVWPSTIRPSLLPSFAWSDVPSRPPVPSGRAYGNWASKGPGIWKD